MESRAAILLWTGMMADGALALSGLPTGRTHTQPETVRVGFVSPQTGPVAACGTSEDHALSNATTGLPQMFAALGSEVIDAGFPQALADDFSDRIAILKDAVVDIVFGVFLPQDVTTF